MRVLRNSAALITACSLAGCAFMSTKGPEDTSGRTKPDCTTELRSSKIDIALGTASGLVGITVGVKIADDHEPLGNSILVSGIVAILAFYASSTIGYVRSKRCKEAISEWHFHQPDSVIDDPTDN